MKKLIEVSKIESAILHTLKDAIEGNPKAPATAEEMLLTRRVVVSLSDKLKSVEVEHEIPQI